MKLTLIRFFPHMSFSWSRGQSQYHIVFSCHVSILSHLWQFPNLSLFSQVLDISEVHWSHILYNVSFFGFSIIRPWLCFLKEYCGYKFWKEHHRTKFPANYIRGYLLSARFIKLNLHPVKVWSVCSSPSLQSCYFPLPVLCYVALGH